MSQSISRTAIVLVVICSLSTLFLSSPQTIGCTRALYESGAKHYIVGRSMDWNEDAATHIWAFPKGMKRDGGCGMGSIRWTSKYGSVAVSFYDAATVDGMNEAGLVANVLYLAEADYGTDKKAGKPSLSIGAWAQYVLDNYGTVAEAVKGLKAEPFRIVAPVLPNGRPASAHLAIADKSGDSAIFEYVDGKLAIHHSRKYTVMTNSPIYEKQLAINAYWDEIGGQAMLPGTPRAADRFARTSYFLKALPKHKDTRLAIAGVFSLIRAISVPLGINDPKKPNIATTIWRTVADANEGLYYYESAFSPNTFWVDIKKLNLKVGAEPKRLNLKGHPILAGEVSSQFKKAELFRWLAP